MRNALRTMVALARRDSSYWQFPLFLSMPTTGTLGISARLFETTLPGWLFAGLAVWCVGLSTLTAWWLLLSSEIRRKRQ